MWTVSTYPDGMGLVATFKLTSSTTVSTYPNYSGQVDTSINFAISVVFLT